MSASTLALVAVVAAFLVLIAAVAIGGVLQAGLAPIAVALA